MQGLFIFSFVQNVEKKSKNFLTKSMKYQVTYISGSGTEYEDGIWTVKRTPKTIIAEKVEENGVYDMHKVGEKIRIGKGTGNPIKNEEEGGSFTVFFQQAGTPYIFIPINN